MNEPVPTGINPLKLVDQDHQDAVAKIADASNQAGFKTSPETVSAGHNFPPEPLQKIGGKIMDEVENVTDFIAAKKEGSSYIDTVPGEKVISIANIRNKLLGKKAA